MDKTMVALNAGVCIFSVIWLIGHSTVRVFDWEFWFASMYSLWSLANWAYLAKMSARPA